MVGSVGLGVETQGWAMALCWRWQTARSPLLAQARSCLFRPQSKSFLPCGVFSWQCYCKKAGAESNSTRTDAGGANFSRLSEEPKRTYPAPL
jgi:hypothetical protein